MVCKISQPKRGLYKNGLGCETTPRPKKPAAKSGLGCEMISQPHAPPLRKFSQLRNTPLAHECHFVALSPISQLRNALRNPQSFKNPIFATKAPFRSWFRSCKTTPWHTSVISQPPPLISQLRNGLRRCPSTTKSTPCCEIAYLLRKLKPSLGIHF